ncbi:monocarboxylate transporter 8-like [Sardina pilchardus]|uniref:monocarboxylate transporter 8-like n=1 Tax=Sardina pilchardus TaxID=27697 RepID=UPI002E116AE8
MECKFMKPGPEGLVAFVGLLTSSFTNSLVLQYITYGLLFGCGSSFTLQPSLVILGHYFHRRLGLANGLVTAGSSLFSVGMPALLEEVVAPLGLSRTFQILSALMLVQVALVSVTFRPRLTSCNHDNEDSMTPSTNQIVGSCCRRFRTRAKQFIGVGVFHVSSFRVWAFSIATAVLGYFVPYVHLMSFVEEQFSEHTGNEWVVLVSIGVSSGIGRLTFGSMGDLIQGVNKIYLQAGSFMLLGLATILMPQCVAFEALVAICGLLGLCDGCFISLMAPVAFTLVGPQRASQAIGYLLGLMALPMTAGPPLAGLLHDHYGDYHLAFYLAGIPPVVGGLLLCLVPRMTHQTPVNQAQEAPELPDAGDESRPNQSKSEAGKDSMAVTQAEDTHL